MDQDNEGPTTKIDNTYMEYAIFSLWKIDVIEHIKIKAALVKNFHIAPSEIDKMQMWEYEIFMKALNDLIKEENDQQKSQMDKYHVDDYMKMANPNNIQKMQQSAMPKMPSMNMPNISIPKY